MSGGQLQSNTAKHDGGGLYEEDVLVAVGNEGL
jgi:hypothetical protein